MASSKKKKAGDSDGTNAATDAEIPSIGRQDSSASLGTSGIAPSFFDFVYESYSFEEDEEHKQRSGALLEPVPWHVLAPNSGRSPKRDELKRGEDDKSEGGKKGTVDEEQRSIEHEPSILKEARAGKHKRAEENHAEIEGKKPAKEPSSSLPGGDANDSSSSSSLRRKKKPKGMPKRPLSAYNLFFRSERAKLLGTSSSSESSASSDGSGNVSVQSKGESPTEEENMTEKMAATRRSELETKNTGDAKGRMGFEDLGKIIGHRWRNLPKEELEHFRYLASKESERYKQEMEEYNDTKKKQQRSDSCGKEKVSRKESESEDVDPKRLETDAQLFDAAFADKTEPMKEKDMSQEANLVPGGMVTSARHGQQQYQIHQEPTWQQQASAGRYSFCIQDPSQPQTSPTDQRQPSSDAGYRAPAQQHAAEPTCFSSSMQNSTQTRGQMQMSGADLQQGQQVYHRSHKTEATQPNQQYHQENPSHQRYNSDAFGPPRAISSMSAPPRDAGDRTTLVVGSLPQRGLRSLVSGSGPPSPNARAGMMASPPQQPVQQQRRQSLPFAGSAWNAPMARTVEGPNQQLYQQLYAQSSHQQPPQQVPHVQPNAMPLPPGLEFTMHDSDGTPRVYQLTYHLVKMSKEEARQYMDGMTASPHQQGDTQGLRPPYPPPVGQALSGGQRDRTFSGRMPYPTQPWSNESGYVVGGMEPIHQHRRQPPQQHHHLPQSAAGPPQPPHLQGQNHGHQFR